MTHQLRGRPDKAFVLLSAQHGGNVSHVFWNGLFSGKNLDYVEKYLKQKFYIF